MSSIPLHPEKGVNPALCYCPICGGDSGEIALMGRHKVYDCIVCGMRHYGVPKNRVCTGCQTVVGPGRDLKDNERVPGTPCDECGEKLKTTNLLICPDCCRIFGCDAHRVLQAFDPQTMTVNEAIEKGYLEVVAGNVIREPCEECHAARKEAHKDE